MYSVYILFYDVLCGTISPNIFLERVRMIVSTSLLDFPNFFSGQFSTAFCIVVVVNNKSTN